MFIVYTKFWRYQVNITRHWRSCLEQGKAIYSTSALYSGDRQLEFGYQLLVCTTLELSDLGLIHIYFKLLHSHDLQLRGGLTVIISFGLYRIDDTSGMTI